MNLGKLSVTTNNCVSVCRAKDCRDGKRNMMLSSAACNAILSSDNSWINISWACRLFFAWLFYLGPFSGRLGVHVFLLVCHSENVPTAKEGLLLTEEFRCFRDSHIRCCWIDRFCEVHEHGFGEMLPKHCNRCSKTFSFRSVKKLISLATKKSVHDS